MTNGSSEISTPVETFAMCFRDSLLLPALPDYNQEIGTVIHHFRRHNLIFSFVRGDGVAQDFQKIFCMP